MACGHESPCCGTVGEFYGFSVPGMAVVAARYNFPERRKTTVEPSIRNLFAPPNPVERTRSRISCRGPNSANARPGGLHFCER